MSLTNDDVALESALRPTSRQEKSSSERFIEKEEGKYKAPVIMKDGEVYKNTL